jgi:hypothetical protein
MKRKKHCKFGTPQSAAPGRATAPTRDYEYLDQADTFFVRPPLVTSTAANAASPAEQ